MSGRTWFGGFGAGLLAGAVGTVVVLGGREWPRAQAQAPAEAPPPGRYQLMTWSHPEGPTQYPSFGAYLLDTATGHLWLTRDGGGLKTVGRGQ